MGGNIRKEIDMYTIDQSLLEEFRNEFDQDENAKNAQAACARTEIKDIVFLPLNAARLNGDFSVEVKTSAVTAQEKSGRCWMFAALNIVREQIGAKCGIKDFELSENYAAFYDKLEKANNVLDLAVKHADDSLDDRMMEYILDGFHDGGYWDMAADIIRKYGVVPKWVMPETYQSSHTATFMKMLNSLIRKDVCELRKMVREGKNPDERRKEMLAEIYRAECIVFGQPPKCFDFEYRDKDGTFHADRNLSPQAFLEKYADFDPDAFITVTNEPTERKKMNSYYRFHYIGSMAESNVRCLNLPMEELKKLSIAQLKDGVPVWFGCDSGAYGDRLSGVWDPESFAYGNVLGNADFFMNKKDRLEYRDSFATHAMILTGVNLDENGKPDRWKIENSWGKEVGKNGYFVCSDHYFDEFVYEVIIDRKYLNEAQKTLLEEEPYEIMPWQV